MNAILPDKWTPTATEKPAKSDLVPALEIDESNGKLYLLEQVIPLGPNYARSKARRDIWNREFTLDAQTLDVLECLAIGVNQSLPTLLEGPTAASKTSAIEYLAAQAGYTCHRINLKGQTDTSEFVGKFVPNPEAKPGEPQLKWQDGLLVRAMKEGHWVILDELNLAEPQILEALNSVLEKHPSITLTDNGGVKVGPGGDFPVHANFRIFATMNPGYTGRQPFSPAFQNRWVNRKYVKTPDQAQLQAMLMHQSFGRQPEVTIKGEKYQSSPSEVSDRMKKFAALPELAVQTVFTRLAKFHSEISQIAEKKEIGRDQDPGHIFTRRELTFFLEFLATHRSFNRRTGMERDLLSNPVAVILEALKTPYLDKMSTADDQKKVQDLLKANLLDEESLKKLFPVFGINQTARGKIGNLLGNLLAEDEDDDSEQDVDDDNPDSELPPEVEALRLPLTADYEKQMKNLEWYGILETAEDGTRYYTADYDGSSEKDPNDENPDDTKRRPCPDAHNFSNEKFTPPTLEKILASLAPQQATLYNEYLEKGLQPRLQLTPLALKLRTMAAKLDAKKEKINAKAGTELIKRDTFIWDSKESGEIDETTLLYEPQTVEASADGEQLITKNGLTKSQLIQKYNGWLVEIVPMKQDLDADPDKKQKEITKDGKPTKVELTNAEKTVLYTEEAHGRGEHGQGYEDYLSAQMNALAEDIPTPLEKDFWTILPESSLTKNKNIVSIGGWNAGQVNLDRSNSDYQRGNLRFRRSVRVYVKP